MTGGIAEAKVAVCNSLALCVQYANGVSATGDHVLVVQRILVSQFALGYRAA